MFRTALSTTHTRVNVYINVYMRHCRFASEVRTFLLDVLPQPVSFQGCPKSLHHTLAAFCEHYRADIEVVCYGVSVSSSSSGAAAAADGDSTTSVVRLKHEPSVEALGEPEVLIRLLYDGATGSLYIVKLHAQRHSARLASAAVAVDVFGRPKRSGKPLSAGPDPKFPRTQQPTREAGAADAASHPMTGGTQGGPKRHADDHATHAGKKPKTAHSASSSNTPRGPLPDPPAFSGFRVGRSNRVTPGRVWFFDPKARVSYWADEEHTWRHIVRQYEEEARKQACANRATAQQRPVDEILPEAAAILARAKGKTPARAAKK
jgi:hypothetical protein